MSIASTQTSDVDRAADIRRQMAELRCELREDFDGVAASAKEFVDWKHYVKQMPLLSFGLAAAVGFAVMPSKATPQASGAVAKQYGDDIQRQPRAMHNHGVTGILMRMATSAIVRTAVGFASQKFSELASPDAASTATKAQQSDIPGNFT